MPVDCNVCQGIEPLTPETVANRPGLPALRYRAGRHGTFLESLIARLSALGNERDTQSASLHPDRPPARSQWLQTREQNDPSIALLDAWATMGEVLTFYQERIANEGYLKTARERRSLHELANQIGYQLRPAMSSSVYLAFDVQEPPQLDPEVKIPKPHEIKIPKGTQAKSIPEPGELPATFETSEELIARPEWNLLKPRMTRPTVIDANSVYNLETLRFKGVDLNLHPGQWLLLVPDTSQSREVQDIAVRPPAIPRRIQSVKLDTDRKQTEVTLVGSPFAYVAFQNKVLEAASLLNQQLEALKSSLDVFRIAFDDLRDVVLKTDTLFKSKQTLIEADSAVFGSLLTPENESGLLNAIRAWETHHKQYEAAHAQIAVEVTALIVLRQRAFHTLATDDASPWNTTSTNLTTAVSVLNAYIDVLVALTEKAMMTSDDLETSLGDDQNLVTLKGLVTTFGMDVNGAFLKGECHKLNEALVGMTGDNFVEAKVRKAIEDFHGGGMDGLATLKAAAVKCQKELADELAKPAWTTEKGTRQEIDLAAKFADAVTSNNGGTGLASRLLTTRSRSLEPGYEQLFNSFKKAAKEAIEKCFKGTAVYGSDKTSITEMFEAVYKKKMVEVVVGINDLEDVSKADSLNEFYKRHRDINSLTTLISAMKASWFEASKPATEAVIAGLLDAKTQLPVSDTGARSRVDDAVDVIKKWEEKNGPRLSFVVGMINAIVDASVKGDSKAVLDSRITALKKALATEAPQVQSPAFTVTEGTGLSDVSSRFGSGTRSLTRTGVRLEDVLHPQGDLVYRLLRRFDVTENRSALDFWENTVGGSPNGKVYRFRHTASLFGATTPSSLEAKCDGSKEVVKVDPITKPEGESENIVFLDHEYSDIVPNGWCLISSPPPSVADKDGGDGGNTANDAVNVINGGVKARVIRESATVQRSAYLQNGKTNRLLLEDNWREVAQEAEFGKILRSTVVFAGSQELTVEDTVISAPYPKPFKEEAELREIELEDREMGVDSKRFYGDLQTGRQLILCGEEIISPTGNLSPTRTGAIRKHLCQVLAAKSNADSNGRVLTTLLIDPPLNIRFVRDTVRIYANVVQATHGESHTEIVGNGEGQGGFQRFVLSQPKLTYLPEATPNGMAPQMEVRVNNVAWKREDKIGEMQPGPGEELPREFLVSVDDDERTFITTGDGKSTGERLPTGVANVAATYRVGGGRSGNVKEGTITQLPSPPLNVSKVRNLLPSSGGVDRENVDQVRVNIPVAVMALDRLVAVADYHSFARKFAGIAKAQATPLTINGVETVVVTVAGLDDIPIEKESLLFTNLNKALNDFADPEQRVVLLPRELMLLMVKAKVKIQKDHQWEIVKPRIMERLLRRFDFEHARLAEAVLLSDVVATIQGTEGVVYVDVDIFDRMRQFYGPGELVRKAACISTAERPKQVVEAKKAREFDDDEKYEDTDIVRIEPAPDKDRTLTVLLKERSFDRGHVISPPLDSPDNTNRKEAIEVTVRIFDNNEEGKHRPPPNAPATGPAPFPAQLAYFANLPGTILLDEIKEGQ